MYRIREFSAMTGLSQSKIRFYEKRGLLLSHREENGYRVFTPEDAFRSNAFRMLLQYGFSIEEAIELVDADQETQSFIHTLQTQHKKLLHEADVISCRLARIQKALTSANSDISADFEVVTMPDYFFVRASLGSDFSISLVNASARAELYDLLYVSHCVRIIRYENLIDDSPEVDIDYANAISEEDVYRVSESSRASLSKFRLGTCVRFRRRLNRTESVRRSSFSELYDYLDTHGYKAKSDAIIFPSFLNLDSRNSDIEVIYVPIV